jgi:hypothetical protein
MNNYANLLSKLTKLNELQEEAGLDLPPCTAITVCKKAHAIDIMLDNTVSYYSEWIPGEGGDIVLYRDEKTKKVVGARLPLYNDAISFMVDE